VIRGLLKRGEKMRERSLVRTLCVFSLALSIHGFPSLQAQEFSQEKALEHLQYIAGTIGPRPLGSPQEKAALTYFAEKMAEFGGKVEWQPVADDGRSQGKSALNTSSFNVIGRFPGETPREIIVGAHIDSASPEIPGADDDGSGVAAMLEIARVLSQVPRQSTLVFVAFCGEEAGLVGSKSFVEHYPLDHVALMLQLDMTSDDAPLMLWIDAKKGQSPEWLVSASIDAFHSLGYRNIDYPTIFQSLNSAMLGAGSDHEPFLEKGIPAIGFVSDIRFPVHTRNDSLEYFKPEGLKRSGRLIVELINKFDRGQPKEKTGRYMLVMIGEKPLYISLSWMAVGILISLVLAVAALSRLCPPYFHSDYNFCFALGDAAPHRLSRSLAGPSRAARPLCLFLPHLRELAGSADTPQVEVEEERVLLFCEVVRVFPGPDPDRLGSSRSSPGLFSGCWAAAHQPGGSYPLDLAQGCSLAAFAVPDVPVACFAGVLPVSLSGDRRDGAGRLEDDPGVRPYEPRACSLDDSLVPAFPPGFRRGLSECEG
jgi:hypothetical protein